MPQELYRWGRIALIMGVVFLGVVTIRELRGLSAVEPASNAITVSGEGEASGVPDVATFTFSIQADAPAVASAQSQVNERTSAILGKLKALGIEDKDIKTADYSVYPKYTYAPVVCTMQYPNNCPPGRQVQEGYTASQSVIVKVRKTEQAGAALSAVGEAGATNLSGLSFTFDDPHKLESEARAAAIADAKARAEALAKELHVRLVRVVSYADSNQGRPVPIYAQAMSAGATDKASVPPVLPVGENKVSISVQVTYEIR